MKKELEVYQSKVFRYMVGVIEGKARFVILKCETGEFLDALEPVVEGITVNKEYLCGLGKVGVVFQEAM